MKKQFDYEGDGTPGHQPSKRRIGIFFNA